VRNRICSVALVMVSVSLSGLLVACGSSNGNSSPPPPPPPVNNVQAIAVNGGPVPGQIYPDGAFTSVTVCVPNSTTCQTVNGILVDTGSVGLRILASAIPNLNLPKLTGNGGVSFYDCVSFIDGSFLWGPVAQADVKMAGEAASASSVHLVEDPVGFSVPPACSNGGVDDDSLAALGANGILGVGPEPLDCGLACDPGVGGTPPPVYFGCLSTGNCQTAFVSASKQVINPVVLFSKDNNGVILEMQALSSPAATATGSMIFGIGTESNNQLGSAKVFTLDNFDNFTTNFNHQSLTASFIDSGSNGLFFPDTEIPQCAANSIAPGFYCPSSTDNLSAQNVGANNMQSTLNFTVGNAVNMFQSNASDAAFPALGGGGFTGSFDWGLPFFYGRNVFVAIDGQAVPAGEPSAPWWAY
jgi:hypothetical protein